MDINRYFDHTLLKANATKAQIDQLIDEAKEYNFYSVCVNSYWVNYCHDALKDSDVKVCSVVGFPLGAMSSKAKAMETKIAVEDGADEIDMVINIGACKEHNYDLVEEDIRAVVEASNGKLVKVIIETCLLDDEEKVEACLAAKRAKADYVKTSTGFSTAGANPKDVALMKKTVGEDLKVKASGGIHTLEECMAMIEAGASRIGASAGVKIMKELE